MSKDCDTSEVEHDEEISESEPDGYKKILRSLKKLLGLKKKKQQDTSTHEERARIKDSFSFTHEEERIRPTTDHIDDLMYQSDRSATLIPSVSKENTALPKQNVASKIENLSSVKTSNLTEDNTVYNFNHVRRGYAVLIIYEEFENQPQRKNAYLDEYYMKQMFSALDFEVRVLKNKTSKELLEELRDIKNSIEDDCDCFACVISSHGMELAVSSANKGDNYKIREHMIFTADGVVRTEEILNQFDDMECRRLRGKPRIFFIQACRCRSDSKVGDDVDKGTKCQVKVISEQTHHTGYKSAQFYGKYKSDWDRPEEESRKCVDESFPDTKGGYKDYAGSQQNPPMSQQPSQPQRYLTTFEKRYGNLFIDLPVFPEVYQNTTPVQFHTPGNTSLKEQLDSSLSLLSRLTEDLDQFPPRTRSKKQQETLDNSIPYADDEFSQLSKQRITSSQTHSTEKQHDNELRDSKIVPNVKYSQRTKNYRIKPVDDTHLHEKHLEFCQIPCFNDFLVMFSSASETIAWSDDGKGGWLMYCLYKVIKKLADSEFDLDLLFILTEVCGKMARELQAHTPSKPQYDESKSAATIYHRLTKDIFLRPKKRKPEITSEL